ncbi:MAG: hypothetical protein ACLFS3_03195 [Candidatus Aenigmatarchaeota archaeon]
MYSGFNELLANPQIQPFLPFFFVLAVVFGLLSITGDEEGLFGKNSVNLIISLVFAFFAAGYSPFVDFFFQYFGVILWIFIGLFFIAFFMQALGIKKAQEQKNWKFAMAILGIVFLILITVGVSLIEEIDIPVLGTDNFLMVIFLLLALGGFFYAFKAGPGSETGGR